ncbi:glycosyltransferase [Sporomusa sphaeroides DSM 2875]|uniref:glycosyltransferase family 2 protein n=1 Tax=Sporomusa sphaeroides TaxID=47679 RepID=UPI00202FF1F4|nr:glycosyltransferase family 2 protein [Sporomusa sphaeroides]MCM0758039.1 glycosyltransferase [Sporomusa sphaeroides DSM 2875]
MNGTKRIINITITVITVCKNSVKTLEAAILSVLYQSYQSIEYIIIDGDSDDGTLEIIQKYSSQIKWVSEPDLGIYDAMNKGIRLATGDYIYFLGADDQLARPDVILQVAEELNRVHDLDILYGRVLEVDRELRLCRMSEGRISSSDVCQGVMIPHQAMFTRAILLRDIPFSLEYCVASDYEFLLRSIIAGRKIVFFDICIALYCWNGLSGTGSICLEEYEDILKKWLPQSRSYQCKLRNERLIRFLKKLTGSMGLSRIIKRRWRGWSEFPIEDDKS